jgi:hypothetical protein
VSYESTVYQWEEGERRLREAGPRERPTLDRVTDRIVAELRRRLGGKFTTEELVALYETGTDWCLEVAMATAPASPEAWESATVCDAAFARYVRGAVDFAGGRRITAG